MYELLQTVKTFPTRGGFCFLAETTMLSYRWTRGFVPCVLTDRAQEQDERSLRRDFMRHRGEAVGPLLITGKPLTVEKYSEEFMKEFAQDFHR